MRRTLDAKASVMTTLLPQSWSPRRLLPTAALLSICLLSSGAPLPAQMAAPRLEIKTDRIASALSAMVADGRAAGASVLIWQDGRETYFGSAGDADREAKR